MGIQVCSGATLTCSFGTAPSTLTVLPTALTNTCSMPAASIMDYAPLVNIMPFGNCITVSNPTVAAATSAALGVLTPMPCIPATAAPWTPGVPTTLVGGNPAVNNSCTVMCSYGGVITVTSPGQTTVMS